ncbi:MarR family transcriptional regulator [Kitasatospora sp. NPDC059146]|uniref:MarR family transcriptional regulator n=1 Tax=Kitasatospora sp. NPDC059146 TaxID=3346741 RepID=UPI0036B7EEBE
MTTTTATATTTAAAPALNPRSIALAHYAARALLEGVLARHGATFEQNVTLRAVTAAGGSVGAGELVAEVAGSLKAPEAAVRAVVGELTAAALLVEHPDGRLELTTAGRELYERAGAETAGISARLYAGIPDADLAAAGRALALITERANAELARRAG